MLDQVTRRKPRIFLEQKIYWNHLECVKEHELSNSPVYFSILLYAATGGKLCGYISPATLLWNLSQTQRQPIAVDIYFLLRGAFYTSDSHQCTFVYKTTVLDDFSWINVGTEER